MGFFTEAIWGWFDSKRAENVALEQKVDLGPKSTGTLRAGFELGAELLT
jgi:hypothetical protein